MVPRHFLVMLGMNLEGHLKKNLVAMAGHMDMILAVAE